MRTPVAAGTVVLVLALALVFSAAEAPAAATPCWKAVIADWSVDTTLDGRYSAACIRQAMQNAPTDLQIYSTIEDDLQTALRTRSVRRLSGVHVSAASLDAPSQSSPISPLVIVLGGLGVLVAGSAAVATVARRRRSAS
jgi:hypothetical protein